MAASSGRRVGPAATIAAVVTVIAATVTGGVGLGGCGSDEREFDAETVVAELNDAGAELALGAPLVSADEDVEVRVVELGDPDDPLATGGTGSLVIVDDSEAGRAEFVRCDSSVSLICFRAANAVLRFEQITPEEQQRVAAAITALQSGEGS